METVVAVVGIVIKLVGMGVNEAVAAVVPVAAAVAAPLAAAFLRLALSPFFSVIHVIDM